MSEAPINSEVLMYRNDDSKELERAKVICHLSDENGNIIGDYNEKVNLNTIMYEVEFLDGTRAPYAANKIAQEIYSEVDFEGRQDLILDEIIDHEVDLSKAIKK